MKLPAGVRFSLNVLILALASVAVAETLVFVSNLMVRPPLKGLENQIMDLALEVREKNDGLQKVGLDSIVIIDIDDLSIEKLGRAQLWPRSFDARVIQNVASGNPKAIGIDFLYTEPDSLTPEYARMLAEKGFDRPEAIIQALSTDEVLAEAIDTSKNVYLSFFDDDAHEQDGRADSSWAMLRTIKGNPSSEIQFPPLNYPILPLEEFARGSRAVGSISMPSMSDGTVRYYHVLQQMPGRTDLAGNFPLYMVMDALGVSESEVSVTEHGLALGDQAFIPLLDDGSFRINWLGTRDSIRYISYYKILDELIPPEFFEGKYVFFGTSASGLQDLKTVPSMSVKMPGVEVHAVAFLNMINQSFIREVSEKQAMPYFVLACMFSVLVFLLLRPWLGFVVSMVFIFGEMSFFILWVLPKAGLVFPVVTLMLITFLAYISASLFTYFVREKKNRELKSAFGRYVSPEVVDQIIRNTSGLHLGGEKKQLTVLFSDIRSFTRYSEQLDPQELVTVLNNYLSQMSDVIFHFKGTIDKFIGDAVMAIFGAPIPQKDHADRGCRVALGMIGRMEHVNRDQAERGHRPLAIGIGLNTGEMTVGNIGSQKRFDYTVIGDAVNLGSRLEELTKFFEVPILASEFTVAECTPGAFIFRELISVIVMGKDTPVRVYELVGEVSHGHKHDIRLPLWNEALHAFRNKELVLAEDLFTKYHNEIPSDKMARYYIEKCKEYTTHPEHFSTVIKMDNK